MGLSLKNLFSKALKIGRPAPDFSLPDQNDKIHKLGDYRGRWVILFFYPKDDSFFCTKEACSFRDYSDEFAKKGAVLLGLNTDSPRSHKAFAEKHGLGYPLLSDFSKKTSESYGVLMPLGISKRVTFIVDPQGLIAECLEWVNWFEYGTKVLGVLERLQKKQE